MKALLTFNIGNNVRVPGGRCSFYAEEHISAPLDYKQEEHLCVFCFSYLVLP